MEVTYTCYTDSMYKNVAALDVWMDRYCFHSKKNSYNLHGNQNKYKKGNNMNKAYVNDQNVLQLTYLLSVQFTLSLGGQLTLETF